MLPAGTATGLTAKMKDMDVEEGELPPIPACEFDGMKGHDHSGCPVCSEGSPCPRKECSCCVLGCGDCCYCLGNFEQLHNADHFEKSCTNWSDDPAFLTAKSLFERSIRLIGHMRQVIKDGESVGFWRYGDTLKWQREANAYFDLRNSPLLYDAESHKDFVLDLAKRLDKCYYKLGQRQGRLPRDTDD